MTAGTVTATLLAGGAGAVLRAWAQEAAGRRGDARRGTLAVNLVGTALLGVLVGAQPPAAVLAIVGAGFCGGLTTFSTWMVQAVVPSPDGAPPRPGPRTVGALGVLAAGLAVGAVALLLGRTLAAGAVLADLRLGVLP
ncbi:MAG: FluC/FEX family fluoride channel [Actinomycetes bacterium]